MNVIKEILINVVGAIGIYVFAIAFLVGLYGVCMIIRDKKEKEK